MGSRSFSIFLDNASIHKVIEVREYLADRDILLIFNAPKRPDLNAAEGAFHVTKMNYRKLVAEQIVRGNSNYKNE